MSCWVVNTSPLIYLAQLDHLDLLRCGADEILVPPAVLQELRAKPDAWSTKLEEAHRAWLRLEAPHEDEVERLRTEGFYASEALVEEVLRAAGE